MCRKWWRYLCGPIGRPEANTLMLVQLLWDRACSLPQLTEYL